MRFLALLASIFWISVILALIFGVSWGTSPPSDLIRKNNWRKKDSIKFEDSNSFEERREYFRNKGYAEVVIVARGKFNTYYYFSPKDEFKEREL